MRSRTSSRSPRGAARPFSPVAIGNARATVALGEDGRSLATLVWSHRPKPRAVPRSWADVAPETPESRALAKELKAAGFRFVGPTTVYSTMQACGLVNDHLAA